jgi:hypothetical protein
VLHAANVSNTFPTSLSPIYFSFAGGPSPTDINQMIIDAYNNAVTVADNTINPVNCGNDLDCQAQILQLQSEAISQATATELGSFIAIAVAADTPLPAALPLFATGLGALGLVGWRRKRKQAA